jgi:hypothetical protein
MFWFFELVLVLVLRRDGTDAATNQPSRTGLLRGGAAQPLKDADQVGPQ